MKKISLLLALLVPLSLILSAFFVVGGQVVFADDEGEELDDDFVAGEIIVRYKGDSEPFQVIKLPPGKSVSQADFEFESEDDVIYAEPNYIAYAFMVPNDPFYSFQWHLDNSVFGGIHTEAAWDISTGTGVTVAVIDTGVAYEDFGSFKQAPDLASTCFVQGYDFVNDDTHANDDNSHGTHVAGTIAQSTNNSLGVAGVAFNSCIMPVKVLGRNGSGTYADVALGIRFAADNGAKVINLSLGGSASSQTLLDAVAYAHAKGVSIFAAAGNDGLSTISFPAAYDDYVVAVGATRFDETLSYYSNFGSSLDIVAPGGDLTVDQNGDGFGDGVLQNTFNPNTKNTGDFSYWFFQGTSMATPHVAAVAAQVIANGNATTPDGVRAVLESTADDLGTAGRDDTYGWGLVNALAALTSAPPAPPPPGDSATLTVVDGYDEKEETTLEADGKTYTVQASDADRWETESGFYTSFQFSDISLPVGATISSVIIKVEHYEESGFSDGSLEWNVGTGWPSAPVVWGTNSAVPVHKQERNEATDSWDVTSFVTADKLNSMELQVKNNDNSKKTLQNYIRAVVTWTTGPAPNQPPVANAGLDQILSDADGSGAETATLNGSGSSDPDGTIVAYEWKEGATVLCTTVSITKNFGLGSHAVTLTVTDNEGAAATNTVVVTVNANVPPAASAGPDQTVIDSNDNGVETIALNGSGSSDSDGTIVSYQWKEGATVLGSSAIVNVNFTVGTHTVTLTVTDNGGATAGDIVVITVNPYINQPPNANAGPDQTFSDNDGTGAEVATVNGSLSSDPDGSIVAYEWREGATVLGTSSIISHSFVVGTHTVALTVTDNKGATNSDTAIIIVDANQAPTANAGAAQTVSDADGTGFETATLSGSGSDLDGSIVNYQWKEGATLLGTTATITTSFSVGAHTITLTVTDNGGLTGSDTVVVTVNANLPPTANAGPGQTVTDSDGNGFETVTLTGSGSDMDGTITAYEWREGATILGTLATLTHSFGVGSHALTLTVTDNGGATGSDTAIVTVNDQPTGPVGEGALFSRNPDFSTEDRDLVVGETLYVKFFSDQLDYNDLNQAKWQVGQAQGTFVNHNDGFYTTQVVLTESVAEVPSGETDELEFQGVIQDNKGRELEGQVIFSVTNNNPPPAGGGGSD